MKTLPHRYGAVEPKARLCFTVARRARATLLQVQVANWAGSEGARPAPKRSFTKGAQQVACGPLLYFNFLDAPALQVS